MTDLQQSSLLHQLQFLSQDNVDLVASYLAMLTTRRYTPGTIQDSFNVIRTFCLLAPPARHPLLAQDLAQTTVRPGAVPGDLVFWNQKRTTRSLSVKAIQKKMERYAEAAGIRASCHSLRHTFASH
ncbi:MAG: hypothetical protein HY731_04055 [Candidatus Tectomicrobia bacterium]|nr:hypothetical protein [Candidatus Tectomicrobia bacterium]